MDNKNRTASNVTDMSSNTIDVMEIIQLSIAPVGIVANLTVIIVFLSNKKLRRKIPNKLIVNQVKLYSIFSGKYYNARFSMDICYIMQDERSGSSIHTNAFQFFLNYTKLTMLSICSAS